MDALKKFAGDHPQITSWIVLAIGMVIILVWSAWDVGFTPGQWTALVVTTILLAGACVWIIGWEDEEDDAQALAEPAQAAVKEADAQAEAKESQS